MRNGRSDLGWAAALFLVALGLRFAHLITIRDSPFFNVLYIDPLWYDEWAQRIAAGHLLADRPFFLDPLYPYFLAAIYASFGHSYTAVGAIQGLLGAAVAPLTLMAARRWFPTPTARLAGVIAAVYLPAIFFGGIVMKTGLSLILASVTLWLLSRALSGARPSPYLASGVAIGMTALTRGNVTLLVPVVALWLLGRADDGDERRGLERLRRALGTRSRWIEASAFVTGAALVLALPAAHNYAVSGGFILSTANSGANLFIGNNPANRSGEYQQLPFINANPKYEQRDFAREAERRAGRPLNDRETSAFWFRESWRFIRDDPGAWLALMGRKVSSFWGAWEIPDSLDYYLYRETAPVLRLPVPGYGLLAPLGLLGAVLVWRRRGWPRLLLVFGATYSASVVVFFVFSRFRMILVPVLYVLAAHAAVDLVARWRGLARGRGIVAAAWPTAAFLAFFLFVNVPVRAHADFWSYRMASLLHLPVRPETPALGLFNLGAAYAALAKDRGESPELLALAEKALRRALEVQGVPEHARIHVELGKVLARQQRNREAISLYEEAARIEPGDYRIHHALGLLYHREREPERAVEAFGHALRIEPRHVASADRLGEALVEIGNREEAEQAFRHALRLAPGDPSALAGLQALGIVP